MQFYTKTRFKIAQFYTKTRAKAKNMFKKEGKISLQAIRNIFFNDVLLRIERDAARRKIDQCVQRRMMSQILSESLLDGGGEFGGMGGCQADRRDVVRKEFFRDGDADGGVRIEDITI